MKPHKHTPATQARLRNRDTILRDGFDKKVNMAQLEANLRNARLAGNGPLLKEAVASVNIDRGPIQTCSEPEPERVRHTVPIRRTVVVQEPVTAPYEVIDPPQPRRDKCCLPQYRALELQLIALPIGKALVWPDPPKGRTTAAGVVYRVGKRHGFTFTTANDKRGLIVTKTGKRT